MAADDEPTADEALNELLAGHAEYLDETIPWTDKYDGAFATFGIRGRDFLVIVLGVN